MDEQKVDRNTEFVRTNYFEKTGEQIDDSGIEDYLNYHLRYGDQLDVSGKFLIPTFAAPFVRGDYGDGFGKFIAGHIGDLYAPNFRSASIFRKYVKCSLPKNEIPDLIILNTVEKATTPYYLIPEEGLTIFRNGILIEELASIGEIHSSFEEGPGHNPEWGIEQLRNWFKFMTSARAKGR